MLLCQQTHKTFKLLPGYGCTSIHSQNGRLHAPQDVGSQYSIQPSFTHTLVYQIIASIPGPKMGDVLRRAWDENHCIVYWDILASQQMLAGINHVATDNFGWWRCVVSRWRGIMASIVSRTNEVTLRWAQLVLGWLTVFRLVYHHGT